MIINVGWRYFYTPIKRSLILLNRVVLFPVLDNSSPVSLRLLVASGMDLSLIRYPEVMERR